MGLVLTGCMASAGTVEVKASQTMLNQLGYNAGTVDGLNGKNTTKAITNFYADSGKVFDGVIDGNEVSDLKLAMSSSNISVSPNTSTSFDRQWMINQPKEDLRLLYLRDHSTLDSIIWYGHETVVGDFNNDGINDVIVTGIPQEMADAGGWKEHSKCHKAVTYGQKGSAPQSLKMAGCEIHKMVPIMMWGKSNGDYSKPTQEVFTNSTGNNQVGGINTLPLIADFNGDGVADLWTLESGPGWDGGYDALWLSQPNGTWDYATFTNIKNPRITFAHGGAVGDIDGDGDIDVVTTSKGKGVWCYFNDGTGTFKLKKCESNFIGYTISLADLDGDGDLDMYAGGNSYKGNGGIGAYGGGSFVFKNNGKGSFRKVSKFKTNGCWVTNPKSNTFDIDGDGDQDIVNSVTMNWYAFTGVQIYENLGNFKFKEHLYQITDWKDYKSNMKFSGWSMTKSCKLMIDGKEANIEAHDLNTHIERFRHVDVDGDGLKDLVFERPYMSSQDRMFSTVHGGWLKNNGTGAGGFDIMKRKDGNSNIRLIRIY